MKSITTFILVFTFILTNCSGSNLRTKSNNKEHYNTDTIKLDSTYLETGWYYIVDNDNNFQRQLDKSNDTFFIDPRPIVTAKNFMKFEIYTSRYGDVGLSILLDKKGTKNWSIATEKAIGNYLAFILDNKLLQVARVNSQITVGVTALNRGDYSKEELEKIRTIIENEK